MTIVLPDHIDDGAALRLLDEALEPDERIAVLEHVTDCADCRARCDTLHLLERGFSAVLTITDPVRLRGVSPVFRDHRPIRTPRQAPWLRAATILFAFGLVSLAAPPVRAWLIEQWIHMTRQEPVSTAEMQMHTAPETAGGPMVTFSVTGSILVVSIAAFQDAGYLTVAFNASVSRIRAEAQDAGAEFLVGPATLRIENAATSTGDYSIALPSGVRTVRVQIGTGPARLLSADTGEPVRRLVLTRQ